MFAIRFAEFHQRRANGDGQGAATDVVAMFREEIVPQAWWAVLLCDAVELLRNGACIQGCGIEYSGLMACEHSWRDVLHIGRRVLADAEAGEHPHHGQPGLRRRLSARALPGDEAG